LVFLHGRMYWHNLQPSAENSQPYTTPGFCTWYAIAVSVPEYNINSTCIKEIKAMYSNKNSKKTYLEGMNEFSEARVRPPKQKWPLYPSLMKKQLEVLL